MPDENRLTAFTNVRLCRSGILTHDEPFVFCSATGLILPPTTDLSTAQTIDKHGAIIAPGFLELQTNGLRGFHFTHFDDEASYARKIDDVAKYLPSTGVAGFWATIPTVHSDEFKKVGVDIVLFPLCVLVFGHLYYRSSRACAVDPPFSLPTVHRRSFFIARCTCRRAILALKQEGGT